MCEREEKEKGRGRKVTLSRDYESTSLPSRLCPKIYVIAIKSPRLNKHRLWGCDKLLSTPPKAETSISRNNSF